MGNNNQIKFSGEKIHKFCKARGDFYEKRDGAYLPSKHDKQVFADASKEFGISASACEYWFNKIEKPIADKMVKESIRNGKFKELCETVLTGNGESPWGIEKILEDFYLIISQIKERDIERVYITVAKNEKKYCSSGHYLTELGFLDNVSIMQYENGDIGFADDGNSGYIFEIGNIKSVICGVVDSDNELVIAKKMFRLLMKNGNIVTVYFDFK